MSTTEVPEVTDLPDDEEVTGLAVRSEPALAEDSTTFFRPQPVGTPATSGETTGRTWPDVVYPYSSNQKYLYLAVLLLIVLGFGTTGHLATLKEALITAGAIGVAWLVLYVIQRNR